MLYRSGALNSAECIAVAILGSSVSPVFSRLQMRECAEGTNTEVVTLRSIDDRTSFPSSPSPADRRTRYRAGTSHLPRLETSHRRSLCPPRCAVLLAAHHHHRRRDVLSSSPFHSYCCSYRPRRDRLRALSSSSSACLSAPPCARRAVVAAALPLSLSHCARYAVLEGPPPPRQRKKKKRKRGSENSNSRFRNMRTRGCQAAQSHTDASESAYGDINVVLHEWIVQIRSDFVQNCSPREHGNTRKRRARACSPTADVLDVTCVMTPAQDVKAVWNKRRQFPMTAATPSHSPEWRAIQSAFLSIPCFACISLSSASLRSRSSRFVSLSWRWYKTVMYRFWMLNPLRWSTAVFASHRSSYTTKAVPFVSFLSPLRGTVVDSGRQDRRYARIARGTIVY